MMHNGWGNVQYTVQSFDPSQRAILFERGGFQHGRGGRSGSFYVSSKPEHCFRIGCLPLAKQEWQAMFCVNRSRISWSCWTGQGSGEPNKDDTRLLRGSQLTTLWLVRVDS